MKKIGEISKQYHVSNRMLRYYEEKGLIHSERGENNYRYYNEDAEIKIKQIYSLRMLEFTTTEIEKILRVQNNFELIQMLYKKLETLQDRAEKLDQLSTIITNFIALLTESNYPFLESLLFSLDNPYQLLRSDTMSQNVLRVIQVPTMKVASFKGYSETPENDAHELANAFIQKHNLKTFRHFGFNNPNPMKDTPVYGYEIWITVDKDYPGEIIKNIQGGLYASYTTTLADIYENWQKLYQLVGESNEYEYDFLEPFEDGTSKHQWLEEMTDYEYFMNQEIPFSVKQLDLLLPIKRV